MAFENVMIGPYSFDLIDGDEISESVADCDVEIVVPVYGSPYIKYNNPISKGYTENTISIEGDEVSFDNLETKINSRDFSTMQISIGDRNFFKGILIGISTQKNVLENPNKIRGQVRFIKI